MDLELNSTQKELNQLPHKTGEAPTVVSSPSNREQDADNKERFASYWEEIDREEGANVLGGFCP